MPDDPVARDVNEAVEQADFRVGVRAMIEMYREARAEGATREEAIAVLVAMLRAYTEADD